MPVYGPRRFRILISARTRYSSGCESSIVPYTEITFIESSNSKCILHRSDGSCYVVYKKLGKIEEDSATAVFSAVIRAIWSTWTLSPRPTDNFI